MQKPLISVIISVYNAGSYLSECIESLLKQSYTNIEIIAIDDFSSDNSFAILEDFSQRDSRLRISRNVKHYGTALTMNRCMKRAEGTIIAFMNAKDISHKNRLMEQYLYLLDHEKAVAIGSQCSFVNEYKHELQQSQFPTINEHTYKKPLDGVTMLFESLSIHRHRIPKDVLHFKTNKYPFIYTDIILKLLRYGEIGNLASVLYTKRMLKLDLQQQSRVRIPSLAKIWLRAITVYDHKISFKSLFLTPLLANLK